MKRMITLGLVLMVALSSFANDTKVSSFILRDFSTRFADAENIAWSQTNGFTVAEFVQDGVRQYAYYNQSGELAVLALPLQTNQLSKALQAGLKKEYADFVVANVFKIDDNENIKYFAVLESGEKKIILSSSTNKWHLVKTSAK